MKLRGMVFHGPLIQHDSLVGKVFRRHRIELVGNLLRYALDRHAHAVEYLWTLLSDAFLDLVPSLCKGSQSSSRSRLLHGCSVEARLHVRSLSVWQPPSLLR